MSIAYEQIAAASHAAFHLELIGTKTDGLDVKVGNGTGFLYRSADQDYLITNWHVVTGRNPDNPSVLLNGFFDSPVRLRLYIATGVNARHFVPLDPPIDLYVDGTPYWYETASNGKRIDVVAIPITLNGYTAFRVNELSVSSTEPLGVLHEAVIVGYPFGIMPGNPLPVWKRASIASEPSIAVDGVPKFFLDVPGRPGMSGSPVFRVSSGFVLEAEAHRALQVVLEGEPSLNAIAALPNLRNRHRRLVLELIGIYSGSVGNQELQNLGLGVTWHASCLHQLFQYRKLGENPFPPHAIQV